MRVCVTFLQFQLIQTNLNRNRPLNRNPNFKYSFNKAESFTAASVTSGKKKMRTSLADANMRYVLKLNKKDAF